MPHRPASISAVNPARITRSEEEPLLCDSGERYRSPHLDDAWLAQHGIDIGPAEATVERLFETGLFTPCEQPRGAVQ